MDVCCSNAMEAHTLEGNIGRAVEIDLCEPCQSLWLDAQENLRLTPGATLVLFRVIGEHVAKPGASNSPASVRAVAHRYAALRICSATRFDNHRCPNNHGRLITFLFPEREGFCQAADTKAGRGTAQEHSNGELFELRVPVHLAKGSDCAHCGSPLSMLDMDHAEQLVAQLRQRTGLINPSIPPCRWRWPGRDGNG